MMDRIAVWIELALLAYTCIGVLFAVPFAFRWANRLDPAAQAGSLGFRLLLLPGAVALWPILALRLAGRPPRLRNAHEGGVPGMAVLRRRHLLTFALLLCAVPFALPLSIAAQRSSATNQNLPPDPLGDRARDFGSVADIAGADEVPAMGGGRFVCAALRDGLLLRKDAPESPDVLAYWTSLQDTAADLPPDARLLGQVDGSPRRFLPPTSGGQVVFYSLAHGKVVATWRVRGH